MSLYTLYRPSTFDHIVGQDALKTILIHQIKTGQVFHNYLFTGGRGTGKTSTARLLAKAVNCTLQDASGMPDLVNDPIIKDANNGKLIDIIEIDAASYTGIDNIREEILDKASYPPVQLRKKVYIIDEVHMLSKSAFNALLKIMEEPPSYLMFILATTELHKVPETIASRCQVYMFRPLTVEQMVGHLTYIANDITPHKQTIIETTPEGLQMIARISGGAMRDAIKYLEQVSMLGVVNEANVTQFLGVVSNHTISTLMQLLMEHNSSGSAAFLSTLALSGTDMVQLIKDCMQYCNDNFSKNPAGYAQIALRLKDLYQNVKWYPSPLLGWNVTFQETSVSIAPTQPLPIIPSPAPISAPVAVVPPTPPVAVSTPEVVVSTPEVALGGLTPGEITAGLIAGCTKASLSMALKSSLMIDRVEDTRIYGIVINEAFYSTLQKSENITYLEEIITGLGKGIYTLHLTYMSKEDYMIKSMH